MTTTSMSGDGAEAPAPIRLLSAPGMVALALLGITVRPASRIVSADMIIREVVTEVLAGFGNAILVLAVFGLFFRTGLRKVGVT